MKLHMIHYMKQSHQCRQKKTHPLTATNTLRGHCLFRVRVGIWPGRMSAREAEHTYIWSTVSDFIDRGEGWGFILVGWTKLSL